MKAKTEFGFGFRKFNIFTPDFKPVFRGYMFDVGVFAIGFHVFHNADEKGLFHTHPAWAWRFVLWGGYVEEVVRDRSDWLGLCADQYIATRKFWPGRFGFVGPRYEHRIDSMYSKRSVSLWVRGPIVDKVKVRYLP